MKDTGPEIVVDADYFPAPDDPSDGDPLLSRLRSEARDAESSEPSMSGLLRRTVLHPGATSFERAVAAVVTHRLSSAAGVEPDVCPMAVRDIFTEALESDEPEMGHTAACAIRTDALACVDRDPACETLLEAVLFFKGYAAIVTHRVSRRRWNGGSRFVALWLQSQASSAFGVDIHPAANLGTGLFFDHATGIVIGETACLGDGCTLLHGVTLGGTGKDAGDRHPKVGKDVLIGAGASVLGNIPIGDGAKIGAGSVVLRPIPHGATAVGAPAKIIGWAKEKNPGSKVDQLLMNVESAGFNGAGISIATNSTGSLTTLISEGSSSSDLAEVEEDSVEGENEEKGEAGDDKGEDHVTEKEVTEVEQEDKRETTERGKSQEEVQKGKRPIKVREVSVNVSDKGKPASMARNATEMINVFKSLPKPRRKRSNSQPLPSLPISWAEEDNDPCALFRSFVNPQQVPPGATTYCGLRHVLLMEGCTDAEVGEVFFELLHSSPPESKYIPKRVFQNMFFDVAGRFTNMGKRNRTQIAAGRIGSRHNKGYEECRETEI